MYLKCEIYCLQHLRRPSLGFFLHVYVLVCRYVGTCLYLSVCTHVCMCDVGTRSQNGALHHILRGRVSHLDPVLADCAILGGHLDFGIPCLCFLSARVTCGPQCSPHIYVGAGLTNSSFHIYCKLFPC